MILTRRKLLTGLIAARIVITTPGLLMRVKVPLIASADPCCPGSHLYIKNRYIGRFETFDGAMSMAQNLGHVHPAGGDEGGRRYGVADSDVAIHTIVIVEWNGLSTAVDIRGHSS